MKPDVAKLRQTILQLAVEGKLVPQDSTDEPVDVLLERIIKNKSLPPVNETDKPFDIPATWEWSRIGELFTVKGGKRVPKGTALLSEATEHVYIRVTDMVNNTVSIDNLRFIDSDTHEKIARYTISKDDVYITIAGTIGRVGIIPDELDGSNLTENAAKISTQGVDKNYLLIALRSKYAQEQFTSRTIQAAQPKLALKRIELTAVPIPPLEEQKRIVAKVDELMALCDELESKSDDFLTTLTKLRQTILQLAVEGKLVPQDSSDEPVEVYLRKNGVSDYGAQELFEIPDSWEWIATLPVSEYIQRGKSPKYVEISSVPVVSQKCVQWKGFDISVARFIDENTLNTYTEERFLQNDDLLINSTGTGTIGRIARYVDSGDYHRAVADSHVTVLRAKFFNPKFYYYWWSSSYVYPHIEDNASGSTNQKELSLSTVKSMPLPFPPIEEQGRIVAKVDELMNLCDELERRLLCQDL